MCNAIFQNSIYRMHIYRGVVIKSKKAELIKHINTVNAIRKVCKSRLVNIKKDL